MFARHTQTRMKGSLAAQGWKALAAKLHGQLPLSPKESQRLLTALTSSFRKHLDDNHPAQAQDADVKRQHSSSPLPKIDKQTLHSSATLADSHLASILTGPLLAGKSVSNTESHLRWAKIEVKGGASPIDALESAQTRGFCSQQLAVFCFRSYLESKAKLSRADRVSQFKTDRVGSRALKWLWSSTSCKDPLYMDDHWFWESLVPLVMEEGKEELLWESLQLDHRVAIKAGTAKATHIERINMLPYLWKGRMLQAMVTQALEFERNSGDAVPALEIYLRAAAMKSKGYRERNHMAWMPTEIAKLPLYRVLRGVGGGEGYRRDNADAQLLFKLMLRCFSDGDVKLRRYVLAIPAGQLYFYLVRGAALSRLRGQERAAQFLLGVVRENCPQTDSQIERQLARYMLDLAHHGVEERETASVDTAT
ncbi:hypothetical protein LTR95_002328 [Oleoguttula sp. CCFEE 5521]